MKVLLASNNPGKVREVRQILSSMDIVTPDQVFDEHVEVEETGSTFEENAYLKASQMGDKSGLITIADDSGLEVDSLGGEPGVYSARYESTQEKRNQKVISKLKNIDKNDRGARYKIAVCIYDPGTKNHQTLSGEVEGIITAKPIGDGGFGYDPIFYSDVLKKTFAQASKEEKNTISHRKITLEKARPILEELASK